MLTTASQIASFDNLPALFFDTASRLKDAPAQWRRQRDGRYLPITYKTLSGAVHRTACNLIKAGIQPGDRVAILMDNRPEWAETDYAILAAGGATVPLYCSYRASDISYVLNDSGAVAVVVAGERLWGHLQQALKDCPQVKHLFGLDIKDSESKTVPYAELQQSTSPHCENALQERLLRLNREALATLLYTSGTTGNPKGVMLSHGNLMANVEAALRVLPFIKSEKMLSFLPLAHAFERLAGHFLPYSIGISVAFAERPDTVAKNLAEAQPTIMISVPRLFEVIRSRILGQVAARPAYGQSLFQAYLETPPNNREGALYQMRRALLDRLVGHKIRQRFGGKLRMLVSGGAPLGADVMEFFEALGLPIIEGYGLSESSPALCLNPVDDRRPGSVGMALPGVELKIADDGEILARGANIMQGYWQLPEMTAEAVVDGWLHTGDIGELSRDDYLTITGRKKEIIVNSGGENIAPARVETVLASDSLISQVMVFGDRRPYLVALLVPDEEACMAWAMANGLPVSSWRSVAESEIMRKELQNRVNAMLKSMPPHEQVRRVAVTHEPFTIENGMLTPTMKLKRQQVFSRYGMLLESLYG